MSAAQTTDRRTIKKPTLAIVIASKNRLYDIRACLASIRGQQTQPDQIIVVDQSLQQYDLSEFGPITHVHNPHLSGLTAARNVAVERLTTDLVLFLDDDVELITDCVAHVKSDFVRRPEAVGLGLDIRWPEPPGLRSRIWQLIFEHGFFNRRPIKRANGTELRRMYGCGMAFRSWLFSKERFDEMLTGYGLGEDWDFAIRVNQYGRLWLCEYASVVHHVSPANRLNLQKARRDRWQHFQYFFDKLQANKHPFNRIWKGWWMFGESIIWIRLGMGVPTSSDRNAYRKILE